MTPLHPAWRQYLDYCDSESVEDIAKVLIYCLADPCGAAKMALMAFSQGRCRVETALLDGAVWLRDGIGQLGRVDTIGSDSTTKSRGAAMASSHSSLYVYLPTRQGQNVAAGTVFVSAQRPGVGEELPLDYEPPRRGGAAGERFADRVDIAARRHVEQTWPREWFSLPVAGLTLVAIYDPDRGTVSPFGPAAEALLARWCEVDSICEVPLTRSLPATLFAEDGWDALCLDDGALLVA